MHLVHLNLAGTSHFCASRFQRSHLMEPRPSEACPAGRIRTPHFRTSGSPPRQLYCRISCDKGMDERFTMASFDPYCLNQSSPEPVSCQDVVRGWYRALRPHQVVQGRRHVGSSRRAYRRRADRRDRLLSFNLKCVESICIIESSY